MQKIYLLKIIQRVLAGIIGIVVFVLMIPAGILILIIDILCQMINRKIR